MYTKQYERQPVTKTPSLLDKYSAQDTDAAVGGTQWQNDKGGNSKGETPKSTTGADDDKSDETDAAADPPLERLPLYVPTPSLLERDEHGITSLEQSQVSEKI